MVKARESVLSRILVAVGGSETSIVNFTHQATPLLAAPTAIGGQIDGTFAKKDVNGANS